MATHKRQFKTIDEYIRTFPKATRSILQRVRRTIRTAAPKAEEAISYQIPTFKLNGKNLVYFAGWKSHVAVYPIPSGDAAFRRELSPHIKGKGTVRFPLNEPIPYDLVKKIVMLRMKEHLEKER